MNSAQQSDDFQQPGCTLRREAKVRRIGLLLCATLGVAGGAALARQVVGTAAPLPLEEYLKIRLTETFPGNSLVDDLRMVNDRPTLKPPKPPFKHPVENAPNDDPAVSKYREELRVFLEMQQAADQLRQQHLIMLTTTKRLKFFSELGGSSRQVSMAQTALAWNGKIFWAPASKDTDTNLQYADQVRSILGPIPPFDVTQLGTRTRPDGWQSETSELHVEVDGNRVMLKPNEGKPGSPLEFEHRDKKGTLVKWTTDVKACDKPSLAGGVTPCGTASRIARLVRGNVEWLALARKTKGVEPLTADQYWSADDPNYRLIGYIGFNRVTGEVAFFDGALPSFSWATPTVAPGGSGYADEAGRAIAARTYDSTFAINCASCHDNKEPRIITPYIKQQRVGYRDDSAAAVFSAGSLFPEMLRSERSPYRVVGKSYSIVHRETIESLRMVEDPTGVCTACHGLTNGNTARFASDAVGRLGSFDGDATENGYRTDWALRSGAGKIHPWMLPPPAGNSLASDPVSPEMSESEWNALLGALQNPGSDAPRVYTSAPAPGALRNDNTKLSDPFKPGSFALTAAPNRDGPGATLPREVTISWAYLNGLGSVPERDDVRFNVVIREVAIPADGAAPGSGDYPTLAEARGDGADELGGGIYSSGSDLIFKNMSFQGHQQWTDPAPATSPRTYRLAFPADARKRYLIRVVPKRFAFDLTDELFGADDYVFYIDVT